MVVVFGHAGWTVLGRGAVAAKNDEAIAVPTLFAFVELTCAVVIVDALHAQSDTAAEITAAGRGLCWHPQTRQSRFMRW
ncbi:MAG: hypothetical protein ABI746_12250 [Dermatophilaceae bacterium]